MQARLICTNCQAHLSNEITVLSTKDDATPAPQFEDGQPITSRGQCLESWEPMQQSFDPANPAKLEFVSQFWLNPADVDDAVEAVEDSSRLNGCCGLAGSNGPNMRCKHCRAEVGTRQSDCWTADVFIPQPGATRWIEIEV